MPNPWRLCSTSHDNEALPKMIYKTSDFRCTEVQYYTKEVNININALPWIVDMDYQIPEKSFQSYYPSPQILTAYSCLASAKSLI